jgi:hypothetical protein
VARIGQRRSAYRVLVGKKRPLRRAKSRWENNLKIGRKEIGSEMMD